MAYDEELAKRVRAALGGVPVEEKKMFGGMAFLVRGRMCLTVGKERIMCRIDPDVHTEALKRKGSRTVVMQGRQLRGYMHVDREAVRTESGLAYWVGLALDYNKRAKATVKKRK
jgi:TfoX/Sxy family transcriptional regulator of competence genes